MSRMLMFRLIVLATLLASLIRTTIAHSGHLGAGEWMVVAVLSAALVASLVGSLRRAV
jgi:hypothetical protein